MMATPIYSNNSNTAKETETALDFNAAELQRTLKLAGLLQTSLEVSSILDYFLSTVKEVVKFDGVHFEYEPLEIELKIGPQSQHRCFYRLRLCEELLGIINFSRKKPFDENELKSLETLLCQLVYPLRNAILYQKALKAAHMDPLTGTNNRAAMDVALQREVELSHRHQIPLSMLVLDLDHFKEINDKYRHSAGDYILKTLVTCINETKRGSDMLFRFGGEEFTLILTGTDNEGAKRIAERLRQSIEAYPFVYDRQEIAVTASFGIATLKTSDTPERLFNKADAALYQAKEAGRNQVHFFEEPNLQAIENP